MTARKYFEADIVELERLVRENKHSRAVLGEVSEELTYRKNTERANQLRREVEALLDGRVARPRRPLKPDSPENQIDILGDP